jgi:hypothetical protein
MTDTTPSPSNEPFDLDVIRADEALLDALGRGEPAASGERIDTLLATWRADLAAEPAQVSTIRSAHPGAEGIETEPTPDNPQRQRDSRQRRMTRRARIAAAAAVIAAIAGGTAAVAATATPGSPLWSISQVIYPARADRIAAEDALAQARRAIDNENFDQARRALRQAEQLISRVHDPRQAARLRGELEQIQQLLVSATAPGGPLPTPTPGPALISSSPRVSAQPPPASGAHTSGPGGLLPSSLLPDLHPYTKPAPRPSSGLLPSIPPLPSVLPTLPIPGVGG